MYVVTYTQTFHTLHAKGGEKIKTSRTFFTNFFLFFCISPKLHHTTKILIVISLLLVGSASLSDVDVRGAVEEFNHLEKELEAEEKKDPYATGILFFTTKTK